MFSHLSFDLLVALYTSCILLAFMFNTILSYLSKKKIVMVDLSTLLLVRKLIIFNVFSFCFCLILRGLHLE